MKNLYRDSFLLLTFFFFLLIASMISKAELAISTGGTALNKETFLNMPFVQNQGQIKEESVLFYTHTKDGTVYVTATGEIIYSLSLSLPSNLSSFFEEAPLEEEISGSYSILESMDSPATLSVIGESPSPAKISYFLGNNPAYWYSNLPAFNIIKLGEVCPGVTLKLKATANNVEKLFFVQPHADPSLIRLRISGTLGLKVSEHGELEARTPVGIIRFSKPYAYQIQSGETEPIEILYNVNVDQYGFTLGSYDPGRELIIDPLLSSTFLGGNHDEWIEDIIIGENGNVYVTGWTGSTNFPTSIGAFDTTSNGQGDVFVSKFDSGLQNLLASTYIGGASFDQNPSIARDEDGNIFICGMTHSDNFPTTPNAYDTSFTYWSDCFISKLDSTLQNLLASTFLGGYNDVGDWGFDISINENGYVFVTGKAGANFPVTTGTYDSTLNSYTDAFISKLDNNLEHLIASTFLGGNDDDQTSSITLDNSGNVYVTGYTFSNNFPTTAGAYDPTYNNLHDVFISKLDANLQNLLASTYLGGSAEDIARDIVLDNTGNIFVTGATLSADFPATSGAYDTSYNGNLDVFISKLNNNCTALLASSYLGSSANEEAYSLAISPGGSIYLTGMTASTDFPITSGAYDTTYNGFGDVFICKLNPLLTSLGASTFLGAANPEMGYTLVLNAAGEVYTAGETQSTNFPTTVNAYDPTYNGFVRDAFISKLDSNLSGGTVGIDTDLTDKLPIEFYLYQNYPNPFNPITKIKYSLPQYSNVILKVFDVLGNEITTLVNEEKPAGTYEITWYAEHLPSGIYFYQLKSGAFIQTKKMILIK